MRFRSRTQSVSPGPKPAITATKLNAEAEAEAEAKLLEAAANRSPEQFSRAVSRWERTQSVDGGATEAERKHQKRSAKRFTDRDGLSGLMALFDPVAGAEFFNVLNTFVSRRWNGLNPDAGLVPPPFDASTSQLMIDALVDMAKAALANLTQLGITPRPSGERQAPHGTDSYQTHGCCVETATRRGNSPQPHRNLTTEYGAGVVGRG